MTLPLFFLDAARTDIKLAVNWYDCKQAGLGDVFIAQVNHTLQFIMDNPRLYTIAIDDVRRAVLRQFPYSIVYRILPDAIEVIGILHSRLNEAVLQKRLPRI